MFSDRQLGDAEARWEEYQRDHDLSGRFGDVAGIDPLTGQVYLGASVLAIVDARRAAGEDSPLVFKQVGFAAVYRKGGDQ